MNQEEFAKFAMALKTYYSKEEKLLANKQAMDLWYMQLNDIPYEVAEAALNKWVSVNKWSPAISDIREYATSISYGDIPDWGSAWELVLESVRRYGMYRQNEAMQYISAANKIAYHCVERMGYNVICLSENVAVERANFRNMYEQYAERERYQRQLPMQLNQRISELQSVATIEKG